MIETFVKRHVTTLMFVLFLVILGIVALGMLNVEEDPEIDFPMVSVNVVYPGASPDEVQKEVLEKMEDAIAEVSEIEQMNSRAYSDFGLIMIEFNLNSDANIKAIEVKDKIEAILNDLPTNVERPTIEKLDVFGEPTIEMALSSTKHDGVYLYNFADKRLKGVLTSIPGVSSVDINGGRERAIRIKLDAERMKQKFVTITDVVNAVTSYNVNLPGGKIRRGMDEVSVRFFAEFQNMQDIENMVITTPEGQEFKLKEIANIEDFAKDLENDAYYNNEPVVLMSVQKVSGGNEVAIADGYYQKLPKIEALLEDGMKVQTVSDNTTIIRTETAGTYESIVVGVILAVLVLIVFTANFRTTFITGLIIPSSIISTFFMINMAGFTINSMTLLGLATVLGTLVSNAIIIIENSISLIEKGKNPYDAAIEGTKKSIVPVFASSGTNLAVFIPISFMGGIVGRFMVQFGLTVVFATILSIIISFSLTPMLIARLLKAKDENQKESIFDKLSNGINNAIKKEYHVILNFIFKFKFVSFLLCMAIFYGTTMLLQYIGNEFMPASDNDKIIIEVKTPEGSSIEKTTQLTGIITDRIRKNHPEAVLATINTIGENGVQNSSITVVLKPADERKLSDLDLISKILPELSDIPDIEVNMRRGGSSGSSTYDVTMNLYGIEYNKMIEYAEQIMQIMREMDSFRSVASNYRIPAKEYRFIPDQEKLNLYGVTNQQIAATIRYSLYGNDTNTYRDIDIYDIIIELNDPLKNNDAMFNNIMVNSQKGMIPVTNLGEVKTVNSYSELRRRDRQSIIEIGGQLSKGTAGQVQSKLNKLIKEKINFEEGYGIYAAGSAERQAETAKEIVKAFVLAVIFTYMVLAATMNSLLHPFTISLSIVTSFSGVFVVMFFTSTSINIGSMLAFIMLVGLAVNAAILVLEPALARIKEKGMSIQDALRESFDENIRTMFMTSLAVVFGTIPQLFETDAMKKSMGAVLVGGMLGSILFTLVLTPLLFYFFETIAQKFKIPSPSELIAKITGKKKKLETINHSNNINIDNN